MASKSKPEISQKEKDLSAGQRLLILFQLHIADRWLERGEEVSDIFAKFFFYFAGFNSLYFLWRKIDGLPDNNEGRHIENLLKKIDERKALEILDKVRGSVEYFCKHGPTQRMDRRTVDRPIRGEMDEGRRWQKRLENGEIFPSERLIAIGQILYLVRSNLVHGSKGEDGDDQEIIENSIEPLKVLLEETILLTRRLCRR